MDRARPALALPLILALVGGPGLAEDAGTPSAPPAASTPVLTVGVEPGTGVRARFDRDLFAAVAGELGMGLAWVEVAPAEAPAALAHGRFDVAAGPFPPGAAATPDALPAVARDGVAVLKRRGDGRVTKPADLAGKAVGLLGSGADQARTRAVLATLRARLPHRPELVAPTADLETGRLAALAGPLDRVAEAGLARPGLFEAVGPPFGPVRLLAPEARPGALATAVAAALLRIRADGRLAALQQRWFGLVFDPPEAPPPPAPSQAAPVSTSKP